MGEEFSLACKDEDHPHTLWYWLSHPYDPIMVPYEANFDNRADAIEMARTLLEDPPVHLRWIKIFRSYNESYTCYRWENPEEESPVPTLPNEPQLQRHWWHFWSKRRD